MNRSILAVFLVAVFVGTSVQAHEGMWLPMFLKQNYKDMKKVGLKLKPEDIYSVNNSSIKDAIVQFGGGCTGEIISAEGLLLTNHHCGFDQIRSHSTVEDDILTNGWWAMNRSEEKSNPGLTASILVRMEDVTEQITAELTNDMTETERQKKASEMGREIAKKATEGTDYNAYVKDFFFGNEFYLFVYITYRDVRLVGAPPQSVGKFGGDTDNWMWPRHTGDFSVFRIYTAPDGTPADYAEENVPLKPKHHLPISLQGVEEEDFTMIMGFPGSTDRYLSSYGVEQAIEKYNPSVVEVRDLKLKIMKKHMKADDAVRLKLASKYASTANYWKYYIGQTEQLKKNNVYAKKLALENEFRDWYSADATLTSKYGEALPMLKEAYASTDGSVKSNVYILEAGILGPAVGLYAFRTARSIEGSLKTIKSLKTKVDEAETEEDKKAAQDELDKRQTAFVERLKVATRNHYDGYDEATDKELVAGLWQLYYDNIPEDQHPAFFTVVKDSMGGDFSKFADELFANSMMADSNKLYAYLENMTAEGFKNDLGAMAGSDFFKLYMKSRSGAGDAAEKKDRGYRMFVSGLREMQPDKFFYPDANFTPRVTYGVVGDYSPRDGVGFKEYTTIEGVMEKKTLRMMSLLCLLNSKSCTTTKIMVSMQMRMVNCPFASFTQQTLRVVILAAR